MGSWSPLRWAACLSSDGQLVVAQMGSSSQLRWAARRRSDGQLVSAQMGSSSSLRWAARLRSDGQIVFEEFGAEVVVELGAVGLAVGTLAEQARVGLEAAHRVQAGVPAAVPAERLRVPLVVVAALGVDLADDVAVLVAKDRLTVVALDGGVGAGDEHHVSLERTTSSSLTPTIVLRDLRWYETDRMGGRYKGGQ